LKKIEKIEKKTYKYVLLFKDWRWLKIHYCLLVHQTPSEYYAFCNDSNLTVFEVLSNDNEITWNLNHY
jgi:hypothetical protein